MDVYVPTCRSVWRMKKDKLPMELDRVWHVISLINAAAAAIIFERASCLASRPELHFELLKTELSQLIGLSSLSLH